MFCHRRSEPCLTPSQLYYLTHLASLRAAAAPVVRSPFVSLTSLVLEPVPLFNRAADGCRPYVEVWQGGERILSTLVDYSHLTAYSSFNGDEAATVALNEVVVCGDVSLIVYHARQQGTLNKTTTGLRMCSVHFHTDSLAPGRPVHRWRLSQLEVVSGNEGRFSDRFRLVLNCVRSEEASSRETVWPRPEARQLLFNSEQDYEATLRLVPRSRSKFFLNNPGWGSTAPGDGIITAATTPATGTEDSSSVTLGEVHPVVPPRVGRSAAVTAATVNHVSAETVAVAPVNLPAVSPDCDDLLGLDSLPPQPTNNRQLVGGSPAEDLLVGLSPPAAHQVGSQELPVAGFDFLADLTQPATIGSSKGRSKQLNRGIVALLQ